MAKTTIKSLSVEEAAPIFNWLTAYAFHTSPPIREEDKFLDQIRHTEGYTNLLALFEGETPVASAAAGPMTQNIRGNLVDMAGIFMVASHPGHRRKGYSFQLMGKLLEQTKDRGFGFSCLYPFRESFYERLGYANLPGTIKVELNIQALKPLLKNTYQTKLEMVEFVQQPDRYHDFIQHYQKQVHGLAAFKKNIPPDPSRHKAWLLFSELDGKTDGLMVYSIGGEIPTKLKFNASRFYPLSLESRYHFLNWIARHIDQTNEVSIMLPAYEHPQSWLSDLEVKLSSHGFSPMGRVLDIEKMNGLKVGNGTFSVEVIDPTCPWNEGAWRFEGQDGRLAVSRTKPAESQLSIQALSALVYGSISPYNFSYRGWGNPTDTQEKHMLEVFPPNPPYLHEFF